MSAVELAPAPQPERRGRSRAATRELWRERLARMAKSRPDIVTQGSAAFDIASYSGERFVPGEVVGWLLTNEADDQGMVGHRLY
jgi:hypothetical protein